jgi:hypothetical protein
LEKEGDSPEKGSKASIPSFGKGQLLPFGEGDFQKKKKKKKKLFSL